MGIGDWGWGIGPNPQSPIPNPQSPIPKIFSQSFYNNYICIKEIISILIYSLIKMRKSLNKDNENFSPDEYVDIINSKNNFSYEGKIMSIKGEKILVENIRNRKEELINKSDNRILKQWKRDRPIQKFNRVDFRLKDTDYWVEGIVMDIMPSPYNKLLIKYKNKNNYKPFAQELVDINDKRIAEIGLYTKDSNDKLLSSTFFNLEQSRFDNSDINFDNVKILNNKRNRPDTNNSLKLY